jgi:hypothetical protein
MCHHSTTALSYASIFGFRVLQNSQTNARNSLAIQGLGGKKRYGGVTADLGEMVAAQARAQLGDQTSYRAQLAQPAYKKTYTHAADAVGDKVLQQASPSKKKKGRRGSFLKVTPRRSVFEGGVRKQGKMEKKGTGTVGWQERYFTIQGHYLRYRDKGLDAGANVDEQNHIADASATKGVLDLNTITNLELECEGRRGSIGLRGKALITIDTTDTQVLLRVANQEEGDCWVGEILRGMIKPLLLDEQAAPPR